MEYTSQIKSIDFWVLLQIVHDVSILVPGVYQAEGGNGRRHPIVGNGGIMLIQLQDDYFVV